MSCRAQQNATQVHNFYQNVFITDMKKEMDDQRTYLDSFIVEEVTGQRQKWSHQALTIIKLKKQNKDMQRVLRKYRFACQCDL